jgi:exodeoxyribonuclease V beta subunit
MAAGGSRLAIDEEPDRDASSGAMGFEVVERASSGSQEEEGARVPLADFPAGVRPGTLLHEILETMDFSLAQEKVEDGLEQKVGEGLSRHGMDSRWRQPLSLALADILQAPLGPGASPPSLCLAQIPRHQRRDEMEFLFAVDRPQGVNASALAEVFRRHGAAPACPGYAERLGQLSFTPFKGFLKGFIDLIFEHRGLWYVVDYKSNFLGSQRQDYGAEHLAKAMASHHYVLQYHLNKSAPIWP